MAYTLEEMRKLRNTSGNFRKLELKAGEPKKIWIPKFIVTYHRKHNKIKQLTSFKSARGDFKDCFNQEYGQKGSGCPICDNEIQAIWGMWKECKEKNDEAGMKRCQAMINDLTGEEFYFNVIDTKDPEHKYQGCRFTPAAYKQLEKIDEKYGIENVIITFSKTEKPTRYALTAEDDRPELIAELKSQLEFFDGRDEPDGGPVDLDKHLIRKVSLADYNSWLTSGEVIEGSEEDNLESLESKSPPKPNTTTNPKETSKPKETTASTTVAPVDDVIPLDDLDAPPPPPKSKAPKATEPAPKEVLKSDFDNVPDLDNLDLDNLDEVEKMVSIEAKTINEKRADKNFIGKVYEFLLKEKKIEAVAEYKAQLLACYNFVKSQGGKFDFPESVSK